jgi:vancomycin resistance protein YoaR
VKRNAALKLFFLLVVSTAYLITFSQAATFAYESFFFNKNVFPKGTVVGTVSVADLSKEEAIQRVSKKVADWKQSAAITLLYDGKEANVPIDLFSFAVKESVQRAVNGKRSPLLVSVDENALRSVLEKLAGNTFSEWLDEQALKQQLISIAASLQPSAQLALMSYAKMEQKQETVISKAMVAVGQHEAELRSWLSRHSSITIGEKQMFSLLDYMKEQGETISSDALTILASAIYEAILPTNFEVIERHTSTALPANIRPGFEARVEEGERDFIFFNPNDSAYTLQLTIEANQLKVSCIGFPFIHKYAIKVDPIEYYEPKTVVQYSAMLKPDEKRVKQEGKQGMLVRVHKEIYDWNNQLLETELVAEDFYPPVHTVVVRGLKNEMPNGENSQEDKETTSQTEPSSPESQENKTKQNSSTSGSKASDEDIWGHEQEQMKGSEEGESS